MQGLVAVTFAVVEQGIIDMHSFFVVQRGIITPIMGGCPARRSRCCKCSPISPGWHTSQQVAALDGQGRSHQSNLRWWKRELLRLM